MSHEWFLNTHPFESRSNPSRVKNIVVIHWDDQLKTSCTYHHDIIKYSYAAAYASHWAPVLCIIWFTEIEFCASWSLNRSFTDPRRNHTELDSAAPFPLQVPYEKKLRLICIRSKVYSICDRKFLLYWVTRTSTMHSPKTIKRS